MLRRFWLVVPSFVAALAFAEPSADGAYPRLSASIGTRPMAEALAEFSRQTGLQLVYVSSIADQLKCHPASAGATAPEALAALLEGSGLAFAFLNARTVRIYPAAPASRPVSGNTPHPRRDSVSDAHGMALEEIIVRGLRGEEPLSRMPVDMVVWSRDEMDTAGIKGIAQLAALTPGIGYATTPALGSDMYSHLAIRGVTNRNGATVAVYVDDAPLPPVRAATYLLTLPVTFDLSRVEVLRGPQPVLFGNHAQGGAIRFITTHPSLTDTSRMATAEWGMTESGGASYELGAALGGPLLPDRLGWRVAGWLREDGGYVDRVDPITLQTAEPDSNRHRQSMARLAFTYAPAADIQLTPSFTVQSVRIGDTSTFNSTVSDPSRGQFRNPSSVSQPFDTTQYFGVLHAAAQIRGLDLNTTLSSLRQYGSATILPFGSPDGQPNLSQPYWISTWQQNYALNAQLANGEATSGVNWTLGLLATTNEAHSPTRSVDAPTTSIRINDQEADVFGQVIVPLPRQFSTTLGLRAGDWRSSWHDETGLINPQRVSGSWLAPSFRFAWQPDDRRLWYLTIAQGVGSSGDYFYPTLSGTAPSIPGDKLWSYEIGTKHSFWSDRGALSVGIFHMSWDNGLAWLQYLYANEHVATSGRATSDGFDAEVRMQLAPQTVLTTSMAYTDARIRQTVYQGSQLIVQSGDALPVTPWKLSASLEHVFPLAQSTNGVLRVDDSYASSSGPTIFQNNRNGAYVTPIPVDPAVNLLNLFAAVRWPSSELSLQVRNALNAHPLLAGSGNGVDNGGDGLAGLYTLTPRTYALAVTWRQ